MKRVLAALLAAGALSACGPAIELDPCKAKDPTQGDVRACARQIMETR